MTNEPADVSEAGPDTDKQAPVGLPAEPIDTNPAGKYSPSDPAPNTDDVPVEQGSGGADE